MEISSEKSCDVRIVSEFKKLAFFHWVSRHRATTAIPRVSVFQRGDLARVSNRPFIAATVKYINDS